MGVSSFYLEPDGTLMSVAVDARGPAFETGAPQALFKTNSRNDAGYDYDVTADGQRFLINRLGAEQTEATAPLTLVVNWPALLKK